MQRRRERVNQLGALQTCLLAFRAMKANEMNIKPLICRRRKNAQH
jgi:hypothetical protein